MIVNDTFITEALDTLVSQVETLCIFMDTLRLGESIGSDLDTNLVDTVQSWSELRSDTLKNEKT